MIPKWKLMICAVLVLLALLIVTGCLHVDIGNMRH